MAQKRTTKTLASRIQVDYLKKKLFFRHWKRVLIIALAAASALWIVFGYAVQDNEAHMPGPLSVSHRMFGNECATCHTKGFEQVENEACLQCHADGVHHLEQESTPRCASCHVEHQHPRMAEGIPPKDCAQCHGDLKRKDGKEPEVAKKIHSINDHPEWAFLQKRDADPAIKLNHKIHMAPGLKGPDGEDVTLKCGDCHTVDEKNDPRGIYQNGTIVFEDHCEKCHRLGFDPQFPEAIAPHETAQDVRDFLTKFYQKQWAENPNIVSQGPARDFAGPKKRAMELGGDEWLRWKLEDAEEKLLARTCLECHDWKYQKGELPEVAEFKMRESYLDLKKGRFDHAAHRGAACVSCHASAPASEKTSDLLIPGVESCKDCHSDKDMAGSSCGTCHTYHGSGLEKVTGPF